MVEPSNMIVPLLREMRGNKSFEAATGMRLQERKVKELEAQK